jgi:hypothetical protein
LFGRRGTAAIGLAEKVAASGKVSHMVPTVSPHRRWVRWTTILGVILSVGAGTIWTLRPDEVISRARQLRYDLTYEEVVSIMGEPTDALGSCFGDGSVMFYDSSFRTALRPYCQRFYAMTRQDIFLEILFRHQVAVRFDRYGRIELITIKGRDVELE